MLETLAAALGVSRYLWEDFLRFQHENLFPVLTDRPALDAARPPPELREALRAASPDGAPPDAAALNAFKDRELFRIDLRHISGRTGFADFSRELSDLAEVVVAEAAALAERTLEERHGAPRLTSGAPCRWTIAALGKFGGREIGFASDLELLTVYEGEGTSDGEEPIPNAAWFEQFVRGLRDAIQAPREGIFELDLRLRPHGDGGSLANSIDQCRSYYAAGGGARQFERMALVRLRPVAGDADLGRTLEEVRDAFVYSGEPFDIAEQLHLRERQATELVAAGERNAKHSSGGLVDVEYYVQVLQIMAGATEPRGAHAEHGRRHRRARRDGAHRLRRRGEAARGVRVPAAADRGAARGARQRARPHDPPDRLTRVRVPLAPPLLRDARGARGGDRRAHGVRRVAVEPTPRGVARRTAPPSKGLAVETFA